MNTESGVNAEDVQYSICIGQDYGKKKWSATDRQEACNRFEEMTGEKVDQASVSEPF